MYMNVVQNKRATILPLSFSMFQVDDDICEREKAPLHNVFLNVMIKGELYRSVYKQQYKTKMF